MIFDRMRRQRAAIPITVCGPLQQKANFTMHLRLSFYVIVGIVWMVLCFPWLRDMVYPSTAPPTETSATPQLVLEAGGHHAIIRTLLFTADGRELVSVSDDKTIRVWSVSTDGRHTTLARVLWGQMEEGRPGMLATAALSPPDATGQQHWLAVGGSLAGSPAERAAVRL